MDVVWPGLEIFREPAARHITRHRHVAPYAAVVLRGGYIEAGDSGRFCALPGDVLLHDAFDAHQDHFGATGADILNLPLRAAPAVAIGWIADPDQVALLARRDQWAAADLLLERLELRTPREIDWQDRLALDIRGGRVASFACWASENGLRPSSLSRGFRLAYGISPQRFRAEQRGAQAARAMCRSRGGLADTAFACGFADQAHMSRTIRRLYGASPTRLRAETVNCVQDGAKGES